jgi:hypothetical protein
LETVMAVAFVVLALAVLALAVLALAVLALAVLERNLHSFLVQAWHRWTSL